MPQIILKVNSNVMRQTAGQITASARELQKDFDKLLEKVRRTSNYWIGLAGDAYRKDFAAQKDEMQQILKILKQYPVDILQMAGIYESGETDNTQVAQALPNDFIN